ncbi:hypothetical protein BGZ94_009387 [Podila epigama]|nr:hypothetical protein BGZ94_009387 [Podila epigama]
MAIENRLPRVEIEFCTGCKWFPEMKELKQLVRNVISPEMGLGHSDTAVKSAQGSKNNTTASSSESSATTTAQTSTVPGQEEVVVAASETKATSQNEGNGPEVECKTCL